MSFSVNSPSKNVILLFSSSEKVYCYCQYSAGNPYQKINKETDGYHIADLGNHFYPRPGVDNDCDYIDNVIAFIDNDCDYIDNECKYKTQEIDVSFLSESSGCNDYIFHGLEFHIGYFIFIREKKMALFLHCLIAQ